MNDGNRPAGLSSLDLSGPVLLFGKLAGVVQFAKVDAIARHPCSIVRQKGETDAFQALLAQDARAVLDAPLPELAGEGIDTVGDNPRVDMIQVDLANRIVLDDIVDQKATEAPEG